MGEQIGLCGVPGGTGESKWNGLDGIMVLVPTPSGP